MFSIVSAICDNTSSWRRSGVWRLFYWHPWYIGWSPGFHVSTFSILLTSLIYWLIAWISREYFQCSIDILDILADRLDFTWVLSVFYWHPWYIGWSPGFHVSTFSILLTSLIYWLIAWISREYFQYSIDILDILADRLDFTWVLSVFYWYPWYIGWSPGFHVSTFSILLTSLIYWLIAWISREYFQCHTSCFNSSPPGQNGRHSGRRHFQMKFLAWKW